MVESDELYPNEQRQLISLIKNELQDNLDALSEEVIEDTPGFVAEDLTSTIRMTKPSMVQIAEKLNNKHVEDKGTEPRRMEEVRELSEKIDERIEELE